jgi:hypothetical protein
MVIFVQRRIRITYQMVGRTGSVAARFDNSKAVIPPSRQPTPPGHKARQSGSHLDDVKRLGRSVEKQAL